ncbi:uncharacterized protein [Periplaneta americana]|uniref:uncharacterized protein isoform X1 n=1 Tax=Periplaneta americana TaxID=6978 RepID=UPI0037E6FE36
MEELWSLTDYVATRWRTFAAEYRALAADIQPPQEKNTTTRCDEMFDSDEDMDGETSEEYVIMADTACQTGSENFVTIEDAQPAQGKCTPSGDEPVPSTSGLRPTRTPQWINQEHEPVPSTSRLRPTRTPQWINRKHEPVPSTSGLRPTRTPQWINRKHEPVPSTSGLPGLQRRKIKSVVSAIIYFLDI